MTLEHKGTRIFSGPIYQPEGDFFKRRDQKKEKERIEEYILNPYASNEGREKFEYFAEHFERYNGWEWRVTSEGYFRRWVAEVWYPALNQRFP